MASFVTTSLLFASLFCFFTAVSFAFELGSVEVARLLLVIEQQLLSSSFLALLSSAVHKMAARVLIVSSLLLLNFLSVFFLWASLDMASLYFNLDVFSSLTVALLLLLSYRSFARRSRPWKFMGAVALLLTAVSAFELVLLNLVIFKGAEVQIVFPDVKQTYEQTKVLCNFFHIVFLQLFVTLADLRGVGYMLGFKALSMDEEEKMEGVNVKLTDERK